MKKDCGACVVGSNPIERHFTFSQAEKNTKFFKTQKRSVLPEITACGPVGKCTPLLVIVGSFQLWEFNSRTTHLLFWSILTSF